jgi:hypothetical protein
VTKLTRSQTREIAGWTGGIREDSEPALAISDDGAGRLRAGENFVHQAGLRLVRRGGTVRRVTFALNAISDVLAVAPFSPTGGLVVTHSAANARHYVHGITEEGAHALPVGAATEAGSRVVLPDEWFGASAARPQIVELFETAETTGGGDGSRWRVGGSECQRGSRWQYGRRLAPAERDRGACLGPLRVGLGRRSDRRWAACAAPFVSRALAG